MNVEFSVDLVKAKTISWPRLETDQYIMVLGCGRTLHHPFELFLAISQIEHRRTGVASPETNPPAADSTGR